MRRNTLRAPEEAMIAVADAGYSLAADDETWLRGVLEAARPVLDHGSFVHGWVVDALSGFRSCAAIQMPEGADFEQHVRHQHLREQPRRIQPLLRERLAHPRKQPPRRPRPVRRGCRPRRHIKSVVTP